MEVIYPLPTHFDLDLHGWITEVRVEGMNDFSFVINGNIVFRIFGPTTFSFTKYLLELHTRLYRRKCLGIDPGRELTEVDRCIARANLLDFSLPALHTSPVCKGREWQSFHANHFCDIELVSNGTFSTFENPRVYVSYFKDTFRK